MTVFTRGSERYAHSVIPQIRSMYLRKVCRQCNTVVHVKRSVCDFGHAFALTWKKWKAWCTAVGEPGNAMKCRKALLSEEELFVMKKGRQSSQSE